MQTLLRFVRLLAIVLWVGGLCFFAFVVAPTAFGVLPSKHLAGLVVGGTLNILHTIGLLCGAFFFAATILTPRNRVRRLFQLSLVALMLALTLYLRMNVVPAMERDRIAAGGDVDAAPANNPARLDFEHLHPFSEKLEGVVLFAGLGVVFLMAGERDTLSS
ncbi:MAG TPA: DUF4149 domain-containing protein [Granulicella sp.]